MTPRPESHIRQALVLLAPGCEDIEAVTILDVLHRGGVGVFGAAVGSREIVGCAHNTRLKPQYAFAREGERPRWGYHYDAIVLPGGMGGSNTGGKTSDESGGWFSPKNQPGSTTTTTDPDIADLERELGVGSNRGTTTTTTTTTTVTTALAAAAALRFCYLDYRKELDKD